MELLNESYIPIRWDSVTTVFILIIAATKGRFY